MANVEWEVTNALGQAAGTTSVDEDQMMNVPHGTDQSKTKRAGDMIAGDCFKFGRSTT